MQGVYQGNGAGPIIWIYTGVLRQFAFDQADKNREVYARYDDVAAFDEGFRVSSELMEELIAYSEGEGIEVDPADVEESRGQLEMRIKANIARNLFGADAYHPIVFKEDPMRTKALEILD